MPPLTNEEREYLKTLADKFHDRVTAPGRDSIEKGTNEKPLTQAEQRAQQTLSDKFNDRVKSPDAKTQDKQSKIAEPFNERVTAPRERPQQSEQGRQQHAPAPGLGSGPRINLQGASDVDRSTFDERQKQANDGSKGLQDAGKTPELSEVEISEFKALSEKYYGLDHESRLDPMPIHDHDRGL